MIYALMKHTLPILALGILLTACGHRGDAEIRKNLPGTWHFVQPSSNPDRSIFTVSPSGDFTNDVIRPDGTLAVELTGTFQVQKGYLIATVTNSGKPLFVLRQKIIQVDSKKMVMMVQGTTKQATMEKDTR
jgi:hypothetical protein